MRSIKNKTVADIGEQGLLAAIARQLGSTTLKPHTKLKTSSLKQTGIIVGVGDDAAVLAAKGDVVLTTDMLVENKDFQLSWATFADIGHKAAAANLSDLAAMGAQPQALLLSLALRANDQVRDVLSLIKQMHQVGSGFGAPVIGGDLSATDGPLVVAVTAIGSIKAKKVMHRHHARLGDIILVSGTLGAAGVALHGFQHGFNVMPALARRQLRPLPQISLGCLLATLPGVHSCADVSDGLAGDALHLVPPNLGVELDPALLPISSLVKRNCKQWQLSAKHYALYGGEDFELVIAAAAHRTSNIQQHAARLGIKLTKVGSVTKQVGLTLGGTNFISPKAFDHFNNN
ncbi:MAG: thiamine-phosphate kinase [Deltaproteobacteria bacterium]|nr:thiamine-phosphate kinase [Deltaproteobacteria bacterium]